ncbi:MAG: LPXTG cell wall anchor domain-containing protein [Clostridia bacterium]|nr:LPXTG cell wall anchor domain-containing protein [Clostridia bacterium]
MKKIVKLALVLCMTIFIMGNVYAALSCHVSVEASKTEVSKNEEFTVDFNISDIQSQRGIISIGATLEYDKDSLELVTMEGKNGWETPAEGSSYNPSKGKIAITRNGLGKDDETVFTATFKAKETSKKNLIVTLKDITVADGTSPAKIERAYQNITVKDGTSNPVPNPGTDEDTNTGNNTDTDTNLVENKVTNNNKNTNKDTTTNTLNKNSANKGNLPKAGETTAMIFVVLIVLAVLVAGIFLIKIKIIDKKLDK